MADQDWYAQTMDALVSVEWLAKHRNEVVLIDVLCGQVEPDTRAEGIPGARVISLDAEGSDHSTGFPHSMLKPQAFQDVLQGMGLHNGNQLVCYDGKGIFSAPRMWWMLRSAGIDAKVLNGGLPAWQAAGFPVAPHDRLPGDGTITVPDTLTGWTDMDGITQALHDPATSVVDARSKARFYGEAPEPRPGLVCGHMPGSINLPYTELLDNGHYRPDAPQRFINFIGDPHPLVTTCGSGVTACILALAATEAGYTDVKVYDGSWAQWGLETLGNPIN